MHDTTPTTALVTISPTRFRRTRIAVSVFFGVLTVALCVLWVRSYWRMDTLHLTARPNGYNATPIAGVWIVSSIGSVSIQGVWTTPFPLISPYRLDSFTGDTPVRYPWYGTNPLLRFLGIDWNYETGPSVVIMTVTVGYWLISSTLLFVSLLLWLCQRPLFSVRFSLRTMLIATTLVAFVLGLGVWLVG